MAKESELDAMRIQLEQERHKYALITFFLSLLLTFQVRGDAGAQARARHGDRRLQGATWHWGEAGREVVSILNL